MPINPSEVVWDEKDIAWDDPNKIPRTAPTSVMEKIRAGFHPAQTDEERQALMANPANKFMTEPLMNTEDVGRGIIRPAMQMGGAALGATATVPVPIPGSSIAGAGAGYVGGGKLYDIGEAALGAGKPKTSGQVLGEIPGEFAEGALSQGFNIGMGKFAKAAQPYLKRMGEKVYSSAAKMPLSMKWTQQRARPTGEVSDRLLATRAAIKDRIPISEKGLEMAKEAETRARGLVDGVINDLTAQGWTGNRADLLKGLDAAYEKAAVSGDPQGAARIIDSVAKKFMKGPQKLSPKNVQMIKQQMYKEAGEYGKKFQGFHEAAHKGIANEAMSSLEGMHPELARLNENDAAYIKLTEALEKATSREANKYAIGLQDALGAAGGGVYGAIKGGNSQSAGEGAAAGLLFTKLMRNPMVLSHLAFALDKASKMTPNPVLERIFSTALAKGVTSVAGPSTAEAAPGAAVAMRDRKKQIDEAAGETPQPSAPPAITASAAAPPQNQSYSNSKVRQGPGGLETYVDGDLDSKWVSVSPAEAAEIDKKGPRALEILERIKKRNNLTAQPEARAEGGPVEAGKPYLVGEKGPEVIVPEKRGRVIPNKVLDEATAKIIKEKIKEEPKKMILDKATALEIMEEAQWDKAKAKKLARERGYIF